MYRQYENPFVLEKKLKELNARKEDEPDNIELALEIAEIKERINFAWQDDEADVEGYE